MINLKIYCNPLYPCNRGRLQEHGQALSTPDGSMSLYRAAEKAQHGREVRKHLNIRCCFLLCAAICHSPLPPLHQQSGADKTDAMTDLSHSAHTQCNKHNVEHN